MPRRDRDDFGEPSKAVVEATPDGRLSSNWKTVIALISIVFGAGMYFNAKSAAFAKIQETSDVAVAAANRLDLRMSKIESRVADMETVINSMDHKIFSIEGKMDMLVRKTGAGPVVDSSR